MADSIKTLLAQSAFSFVGTIVHLGGATMTNLPIDDHTAVVQVDHVLHSPASFSHTAGQRITIQLLSGEATPAVGQSFAFFAQGLAFGESIAVAEVGRLPISDVEPFATAAAANGAVAGAFANQLGEIRDDNLRSHARGADAIVVGRVVATEKAGAASPSEHDPDWWRATLEVSHVEKGAVTAGNLTFLFANSRDVRWHEAPKARAGEEGVWILHKTDAATADLAPFVIRHPDDYQPTQQLDVLRKSGD